MTVQKIVVPKVKSSRLTYQRVTRAVEFEDGIVLILKAGENLVGEDFEPDYTVIWEKNGAATNEPDWALNLSASKLDSLFSEDVYPADDE